MKEFNAKETTEKIIEFIRNYYQENNLKGVVLGISGGKDSGVVAGLFAKAIGPENIIGVTMPCHSKTIDRTDAELVAEKYGFKLINVDLTDVYESFQNQVKLVDDFTQSDDCEINLKPRLRMSTLYYIAQMYTTLTGKPYIVAGTGNKCEQYVGYFTKGGDGVCDINPIGDLTVEEVIAVGEVVEVPEQVLYKAPSDGLSGKTDEDKLGVTYKAIADYMEDPNLVDEETRNKIFKMHKRNEHKFYIPTYKK